MAIFAWMKEASPPLYHHIYAWLLSMTQSLSWVKGHRPTVTHPGIMYVAGSCPSSQHKCESCRLQDPGGGFPSQEAAKGEPRCEPKVMKSIICACLHKGSTYDMPVIVNGCQWHPYLAQVCLQ